MTTKISQDRIYESPDLRVIPRRLNHKRNEIPIRLSSFLQAALNSVSHVQDIHEIHIPHLLIYFGVASTQQMLWNSASKFPDEQP
jgi:hypothetical protein